MAAINYAQIGGTKYDFADGVNLAKPFSASTAYAVGDYVINPSDGLLYQFITAHPAGAWNSAHVSRAIVGDEVSQLKSATNDLNDAVFDTVSLNISATSDGYRLNESDGLYSANTDYKIVKYQVSAGNVLRIISDDRFQFADRSTVNTSSTSYRIGSTYGTGEYMVTVPDGATYLLMSTPTESNASTYLSETIPGGIKYLPVTTLTKDQFERGSIGVPSTQPSAYNAGSRIRTKFPIVSVNDLIVSVNTQSYNNARFRLYKYENGLESEYISDWITSTLIPAGTPFRLLVSINPASSANNTIDAIFAVLKIITVPRIINITEIKSEYFENGGMSGANFTNFAWKARIRSSGIMRSTQRIAIAMDTQTNPNAKVVLLRYSDDGTFLGDSGWQTETVIEPGQNFRIVMTLDNTVDPGTSAPIVPVETILAGAYIDNNVGAIQRPLIASHQGTTDEVANYNKIDGYIKAGKTGYKVAETDIQRTSDGAIVCSHDSSFVDATSGETIIIKDKTLAELEACDYYGGKIATFDELLDVCKRYNMEIIIDQLDNAYTGQNWDTLFSIIRKYSYFDKVWFVCYRQNEMANILQRITKPRVLFSQSYGASSLAPMIEFADAQAENCGEVGISFFTSNYTQDAVVNAIEGMNPWYKVFVYPFDTVEQKRTWAKYADYATTNTNIALYPEDI